MSELSLLIFGKVVTIIAAGGVYLYILERTVTSKKRSDSRAEKHGVMTVEPVKDLA